uniref:Variant surface glycoprotein 1125.4303 n=1 Tax=Trypanosoma brucei TaxID=5691 RepID=A0A1J0RAG3_9TRYP|nr:variant surface glycoprotein 1125.4303 [Trypanosoma brucei]
MISTVTARFATLLAVFLISTPYGEVGADPSKTLLRKITSPCSEVRFLKAIRANLQQRLDTSYQQLQDLIDDLGLLKLAAANYKPTKQAAQYQALEALALTKLEALKAAFKARRNAWQDAIQVVDTRTDHLTLLSVTDLLTPRTPTGTATPALETTYLTAGSAGACTVTIPPSTPKPETCPDAGDEAILESVAQYLATYKTLTLVHDDQLKRRELKIKAIAQGNVNGNPNGGTNAHICGTFVSPSSVTSAVGVHTVTPTKPQQKTNSAVKFTASLSTAEWESITDTDKNLLQTTDKVAAAICKGARQSAPTTNKVTATTLAALTADPDMQQIAIAPQPDKYPPNKEVEDKKQAVKSLLGDTDSTVSEVFLKTALANPVSYKIAGRDTSEPLASLATGNKVGQAAAVLYVKYAKQGAVCTTAAVETGETPLKCSEKTKKDECHESCEWKGSEQEGKCQAKEGVKVAEKKDDKCSDKKNDECKSPDCKWEDETCKDYGFLVKKLSLIAAAFMALIFLKILSFKKNFAV